MTPHQSVTHIKTTVAFIALMAVLLIIGLSTYISPFRQEAKGQARSNPNDWYVAPDGLESNPGTIEAPWDIESALVNTTDVQPGDTIWLRGGTYYHPDRSSRTRGYSFNLQGTEEAPVTVRAYPGERATIDGGLQTSGTPRHVRIQDLEIIVSENFTHSRTSSQSGSFATDLNRPAGGVQLTTGDDIKLINNIVHANTASGIGFWAPLSGESELYGNLIYDNGWIGPDAPHGHGIYAQNEPGDWKHIRDNIIFDSYSTAVQVYGSHGKLDQFVFQRNFFPASITHSGPFLVGGGGVADHIMVSDNVFYENHLLIGYGAGADDVVVSGNTLIGSVGLPGGNVTNLTQSDNFIWKDGWPARIDGVQVPVPTSPSIFLNLNVYDSNRANLAIMALQGETTAQVDLGSLLESGDTFHLKDPADFFGDPVYVGTYTGSPVSVPLTSEFTVYVVLKNGQWGGPPLNIPENHMPETNDDLYNTAIDTAIQVGASGVLGNDTDADGDTLSAILVTPPSYGTVDLNSDGAFTYTPDAGFQGADGFTYRVNDGTDYSTIATAVIHVGPLQASVINFNDHEILSYGGRLDVEGPVTIEDNGVTLHMAGNRWKAIEVSYYVSEDTVLEFDFRSTNQGNVHGIGFDTDLLLSADRAFKLYGTQDWGFGDFADYADTAPNTKHYQIPVGQFYTGLMRQLFFVNHHHDVDNPTAESFFSNVRVYESASGNVPPMAANDGPVTTAQDTPITIDVIANDTSITGTIDPTSVTIAAAPQAGSTIVNDNGTVTYTPNTDFSGTDTFSYTVQDNEGTVSNEATVTITVTAQQPPVITTEQDSYTVEIGETLNILITATDTDSNNITLDANVADFPGAKLQ